MQSIHLTASRQGLIAETVFLLASAILLFGTGFTFPPAIPLDARKRIPVASCGILAPPLWAQVRRVFGGARLMMSCETWPDLRSLTSRMKVVFTTIAVLGTMVRVKA